MEYTEEEIKKYMGLSAAELTDNGICPTCFDRQTNGSVFGDDTLLKFYEDKDIVCEFVGNPRADGHAMISTKTHYHDLVEAPDELNEKIIRFAKEIMIDIKEIFGCERVYLCTMADGPMNHYHVQMIPRYAFEKRGSKNFTKDRKPYEYDEVKFRKIKKALRDYAEKIGEQNQLQ